MLRWWGVVQVMALVAMDEPAVASGPEAGKAVRDAKVGFLAVV
jgi:hypothetical protein